MDLSLDDIIKNSRQPKPAKHAGKRAPMRRAKGQKMQVDGGAKPAPSAKQAVRQGFSAKSKAARVAKTAKARGMEIDTAVDVVRRKPKAKKFKVSTPITTTLKEKIAEARARQTAGGSGSGGAKPPPSPKAKPFEIKVTIQGSASKRKPPVKGKLPLKVGSRGIVKPRAGGAKFAVAQRASSSAAQTPHRKVMVVGANSRKKVQGRAPGKIPGNRPNTGKRPNINKRPNNTLSARFGK